MGVLLLLNQGYVVSEQLHMKHNTRITREY